MIKVTYGIGFKKPPFILISNIKSKMIKIEFYYIICSFVVTVVKIKQKERKNNADTLYEVVCLESESERERRKTTASPSARLPQSGSQSSMIPSPPEDDEDEGKCREIVWRVEGYPHCCNA